MLPSKSRYKIPSLESGVNRVISLIFYFRLIFALIAICTIGYIAFIVYGHTLEPNDKIRNVIYVLTAGSIIIGIGYSIINYEHNHNKFNHDNQTSKEILTFNTAAKMLDTTMIDHFRHIREFYDSHQKKFYKQSYFKIDKLLLNADLRGHFVAIFNYFEIISIGVNQDIMDKDYVKEFFSTLFVKYYKQYGKYIEHIQQTKDPRTFKAYMELAENWKKAI